MQSQKENNTGRTPEYPAQNKNQSPINSNSNDAPKFFCKVSKHPVRIYGNDEPIKLDKEGHPYIGRSLEEVFGSKPTTN